MSLLNNSNGVCNNKKQTILFLSFERTKKDLDDDLIRLSLGNLKREDEMLINMKSNNSYILTKKLEYGEISVDDIYGIINDLKDDGVEVTSVIVDTITGIASQPEEKVESYNLLKNKLRCLAKYFDIPVVVGVHFTRAESSKLLQLFKKHKKL